MCSRYGVFRCANGHVGQVQTFARSIRCRSQRAGYQCRLTAWRVPNR